MDRGVSRQVGKTVAKQGWRAESGLPITECLGTEVKITWLRMQFFWQRQIYQLFWTSKEINQGITHWSARTLEHQIVAREPSK
jgi:hypothetical protein